MSRALEIAAAVVVYGALAPPFLIVAGCLRVQSALRRRKHEPRGQERLDERQVLVAKQRGRNERRAEI